MFFSMAAVVAGGVLQPIGAGCVARICNPMVSENNK